MKKTLEKDIQRLIMEWLRWNKVFCWKNNSVGIKKPNGSFIQVGMRGVSDILGILNGGIFLAIEVKVPNKKPSPFQVEFINHIIENGGIAFVAHSLEEVKFELKDYFL